VRGADQHEAAAATEVENGFGPAPWNAIEKPFSFPQLADLAVVEHPAAHESAGEPREQARVREVDMSDDSGPQSVSCRKVEGETDDGDDEQVADDARSVDAVVGLNRGRALG